MSKTCSPCEGFDTWHTITADDRTHGCQRLCKHKLAKTATQAPTCLLWLAPCLNGEPQPPSCSLCQPYCTPCTGQCGRSPQCCTTCTMMGATARKPNSPQPQPAPPNQTPTPQPNFCSQQAQNLPAEKARAQECRGLKMQPPPPSNAADLLCRNSTQTHTREGAAALVKAILLTPQRCHYMHERGLPPH